MKKILLFQLILVLFINYKLFSQLNKHYEHENINNSINTNKDNTNSLYLKEKSKPVANFTVMDSVICIGQYITFIDESSPDSYYYYWSFEGGSDTSSNTKNPVIYYHHAGVFRVKLIVLTTGVNESDTLIKNKFITVTECAENYIFIPNIFTPNEDGQNDVLNVISPYIKTMNMQIYDRWGKKVHEVSGGMSESWKGEIIVWDGEINGVKAEQGTYIYYMDVEFKNGETTRKKGNFSLIR